MLTKLACNTEFRAGSMSAWVSCTILLGFLLCGHVSHAAAPGDPTAPAMAKRTVQLHYLPQTRLASYQIDLPAGYDAGREKPYPLILLLHGRGSSGAKMVGLINALTLQDVIWARMNAPHEILGGREAYEYWPEWTRMEGNQDWQAKAAKLGAQWYGQIVRDITRRMHVDKDRVLIVGFSQGAAMAYFAAMENPALFAGAAPLGGWIIDSYNDPSWFEGLKKHGVALFIAHGSEDKVIEPARAKAVRDQATAAGIDVEMKMYPAGHTVSKGMLEDLGAWIQRICKRAQPD